MKRPTVNRHGTPLSYEGYVLCGICQEEVRTISRDTRQEYAFCRDHDGSKRAEERERKRQEFFERKRQEKEMNT